MKFGKYVMTAIVCVCAAAAVAAAIAARAPRPGARRKAERPRPPTRRIGRMLPSSPPERTEPPWNELNGKWSISICHCATIIKFCGRKARENL